MPLVDYEEQRLFMGLPAGQDEALLGDLLSAVTKLFENAVGRSDCPFGKAQLARVEIVDPIPYSRKLWLDYPIQALTAVALGLDVAAPSESLNPAIAGQVIWRPGSRMIQRTDGAVWRREWPLWVRVTYDTAPDLPKDVKLAVMGAVSRLYREKDTGVVKSWTLGDESQTLETAAVGGDTNWEAAVLNHSRGLVA